MWRKGLLLFFCMMAALALLASPQVQAAIIVNSPGNTYPDHTSVDGHVNFMVLDRSNPGTDDTWGTGLDGFDLKFSHGVASGGLDTTALYLYLFQTVNDGDNGADVASNSVEVPRTLVTSWGHFVDLGFTENGVTTAAGGPYLSGISALPSPHSGASVGGALSGVILDNTAVAPSTVTRRGTSVEAAFTWPELAQGNVSMLWGYTSNLPPSWGRTSMQDGGTSAEGTVPTPTPEPASLLLWSVLGAAGAAWSWRRRRLQPS